MDVAEPRVRRRGLFLTSQDPDSDSAEHAEYDAAEGVSIRVRFIRPKIRVHTTGHVTAPAADRARHALKSASAIGSRRRSRSRR
jgi:hypothetical protein